MTPNDKLKQLERAFEAALIEVAKATDGAGLKIHLTPSAIMTGDSSADLIAASRPLTPEQFRYRILELCGAYPAKASYPGYRAEEAAARNVVLLAKAWEAAVRYWEFQKLMEH